MALSTIDTNQIKDGGVTNADLRQALRVIHFAQTLPALPVT